MEDNLGNNLSLEGKGMNILIMWIIDGNSMKSEGKSVKRVTFRIFFEGLSGVMSNPHTGNGKLEELGKV
jgi:hypothetical protein